MEMRQKSLVRGRIVFLFIAGMLLLSACGVSITFDGNGTPESGAPTNDPATATAPTPDLAATVAAIQTRTAAEVTPEPSVLEPGISVSGSISEDDWKLLQGEESLADLYTIVLEAGQAVAFDVDTPEQGELLDLRIDIYDDTWERVAHNGDSEGSDPLARLVAPETGTYHVRVKAVDWAGELDPATHTYALAVESIVLFDPDTPPTDDVLYNPPSTGSLRVPAGDIVAGESGLPDGCLGYVNTAPAALFLVDYQDLLSPDLIGVAFTPQEGIDTTLIIRDPNGEFLCDDDSGPGYDPYLELDRPPEGAYTVWIGTIEPIEADDFTGEFAVLDVASELARQSLDPASWLDEQTVVYGGERSEPEALTVAGAAYEIQASESRTLPDWCYGWATKAATMRLFYQAVGGVGPAQIRLTYLPDEPQDTTLLVMDPGGDWHCDDEGGPSASPSVVLDDPPPGNYLVWVGTWFEDDLQEGELVVQSSEPGAAGVADAVSFPQRCTGNQLFGWAEEGQSVRINRHRPVGGDANWASSMDAFVGQEAVITELRANDDAGCTTVRLDVDDGEWFWRLRDLDWIP